MLDVEGDSLKGWNVLVGPPCPVHGLDAVRQSSGAATVICMKIDGIKVIVDVSAEGRSRLKVLNEATTAGLCVHLLGEGVGTASGS